MIREATAADLPSVVAMGQRFLHETPYGAHVGENATQLHATAAGLVASADAAILLAERAGAVIGMLALWIFVHPFSGERFASEVVWWVEPEHRQGTTGTRLLKRAEQWARERGAAALQMVAPTERVGQFYAKCGYGLVETTYQRRLR